MIIGRFTPLGRAWEADNIRLANLKPCLTLDVFKPLIKCFSDLTSFSESICRPDGKVKVLAMLY